MLKLLSIICFFFLPSVCMAGNLFVFIGGFNSCPSFESDSLLPTGKSLLGLGEESVAKPGKIFEASGLSTTIDAEENGHEVVFACFTRLLKTKLLKEGALNHLNFRYFSVGDRSFKKESTVVIDQRYLTGPVFLEGFYSSLAAYLKKSGQIPVVIGHSYGGYSAMHLTSKLLKGGFEVGGLVTLDAISPVLCKAKDMIFRLHQTLLGTHSGCRGFPADELSLKVQRELSAAEGLSWWANAYQDDFRPLQGGPVEVPKFKVSDRFTNGKVEVVTTNFFLPDYHSLMAIDLGMWQELRSKRVLVKKSQ